MNRGRQPPSTLGVAPDGTAATTVPHTGDVGDLGGTYVSAGASTSVQCVEP